MNASTSIDIEPPKPISSPRRTLPEAPPSYYDFPPSYSANGDNYTDELPAYCPREFPGRACLSDQPPPTTRVYTVMPRQAYAIRMNRIPRQAPPPVLHPRRQLNNLFGLAFFIIFFILSVVILIIVNNFSPSFGSKST